MNRSYIRDRLEPAGADDRIALAQAGLPRRRPAMTRWLFPGAGS
ncbi:hypothetical protein ACFQ88_07635 [Paenibacillus sp. NPDC056579]